MDSDWAIFVEDNDNNKGQKYPFWEKTGFTSGLFHNLQFVTMMKKKLQRWK